MRERGAKSGAFPVVRSSGHAGRGRDPYASRWRRGIDLDAAARFAGISSTRLEFIETGLVVASPEERERLEGFYGCDVEWSQ